MAAQRKARIGSLISHGGQVIEGSPKTTVNGIPTSRVGDKAVCVIHGLVAIATGSNTVFVDGKRQARIGDACTCGAIITTGSPNVYAG